MFLNSSFVRGFQALSSFGGRQCLNEFLLKVFLEIINQGDFCPRRRDGQKGVDGNVVLKFIGTVVVGDIAYDIAVT